MARKPMKRILLSCCILLASFLTVQAQKKGYWAFEKEFVYLDDHDIKSRNNGKDIGIRHYAPGSATFTLTTSMGPSGKTPPPVLMPIGNSSDQEARRREEEENARLWDEYLKAETSRKTTDEFEVEWKLNAPDIIYLGDEDQVSVKYEIHKNGGSCDNPSKFYGGTIDYVSTISYGYCAKGVLNEDSGKYYSFNQSLSFFNGTFSEFEDFLSEIDDTDMVGENGNESTASSGTLRGQQEEWRPDASPDPRSALMFVVFVNTWNYRDVVSLPVEFSFYHILVYKFVQSDNIAITHEASENPGEDEGTDIPWWITVPAGGLIIEEIGRHIIKGKNKKSSDKGKGKKKEEEKKPEEEEKKEEPKKPSKFKMILAKEFGNTIKASDGPQRVGVRIEEIKPDGTKVKRPDMTELIQAKAGQNMSIQDSFFKGDYLFADIFADLPDGEKQGKGTVTFIFFGPAGQLQNNVVFNLVNDEQEIRFQQPNMTFIAGKKMECNMAFAVLGFGGDGSDLDFDIQIDSSEPNRFELSGVRPDEMKGLWCFDIKDTAEGGDDEPGRMDSYICKVTAKHLDKKSGLEKKLEGTFELFRFYEGLRFEVEHIKAYPVVKGTGGLKDKPVLPKTYREHMEAPHSGAWVTLFVYDEAKNELASPVIPEVKFTVVDVPDSVRFSGLHGEEIKDPCYNLGVDFDTENASVSGNLNTMLVEFWTHQFLKPTAMAKAKITASVQYNGKEYSASREVMAYSMYKRPINSAERAVYLEEDKIVEKDINRMRSQLLSKESAPQMRPLIHKLGLLLDSYDQNFGYDMVEYNHLRNVFQRFVTGEIGPFYVNECVYNEQEVDWGEAFDATLADCSAVFPDNFLGRILVDVMTLGYAELYYTPKDFLVACRTAAYDEKRSHDFWSNFQVGGDFAAKQYLMAWGVSSALKFGMSTRYGQALQNSYQTFKGNVAKTISELTQRNSCFAYANRAVQSVRKVANMKIKLRSEAKNCLEVGRQRVEGSEELTNMKKLYKEARMQGKAKVDKFKELCDSPTATNEELQHAMMEISQDRYAKTELNNVKNISDKYRWRYKTEKDIMIGHMKPRLKKLIAEAYGVHESEVTFFEATGNSSKSAVSCKSGGMDTDYTIRVRGKDLPEADAAKFWDQELYKANHGGKTASAAEMAQYAHDAEHTAVSEYSAEAFPKKDLPKITDKSRAYEKFEDAQGVADTQIYKVREHLNEAVELQIKARNCSSPEEAEALLKKAMACYQEAARQCPKGMTRTFEAKVEAVYARGNEGHINEALVYDAMKTREIIEETFERVKAGDDGALVEMMAYFETETSSLSTKVENTFGMIPVLNNYI